MRPAIAAAMDEARDILTDRAVREADRDDQVEAVPGELAHHLLALHRVRDLEVAEDDAGVAGEAGDLEDPP